MAVAKKSASLDYARAEEQKVVEFLRGTDALILDTQYDCAEYETHVGWGHGCVDDGVALALNSGAKQLYLFHHDPDHDDEKLDRMAAHARELVAREQAALQVEVAREGAVVELAAAAARRSDS